VQLLVFFIFGLRARGNRDTDFDMMGRRMCSVIHIDTILRSAHLIGVPAGSQRLPKTFTHHDTLYAFRLFYVNTYADHHAHEIAF
jgi:hypothetical protein